MEKRLERIIISRLFDRFDYDINLNNGEDVAILSAPNGCGKTTIFNIVDYMFMPTLKKLKRVVECPFRECRCVLSNGNSVLLRMLQNGKNERKRCASGDRRPSYIAGIGYGAIMERWPSLHILDASSKEIDSFDIQNTLGKLSEVLFQRITIDEDNTDIEKIYERAYMNEGFLEQYISQVFQKVKMFLERNECNLDIQFIMADRLHSQEDINESRRHYKSERGEERNPLRMACNEIRDRYYLELRERYHERQSNASESLPQSYLKAKETKLSFERFKKKWDAYINDIKKFYEIGLLDSDKTILSEEELEQAYGDKKTFLYVYLETFEKTLDPLRKEYDRMKLFTEILNNRNRGTHKEMGYGKNGIEITVEGKPLDITCLSSGEKHDFIMFYNLIFKAKRGSLVFIDEPEISLHINWQEEYIDRLLEICKINDLQAVIATHSPNIVNEHFDLLVERGVRNVIN